MRAASQPCMFARAGGYVLQIILTLISIWHERVDSQKAEPLVMKKAEEDDTR